MKRLLPALVLLLVGACNGSSGSATPAPSGVQTQPTPTAIVCPKVVKPKFAWPAEVPADLPQPPAAALTNVTHTKDGLTIVRFSTASSLQDSVLFVVRQVQAAGFSLGRGDAEPAEADAPFGRDNLRGVYKMVAVQSCLTEWLVAVTRATPTSTSPLLPTPSHGPSSHPLPFG